MIASPLLAAAQNVPADYTDGRTTWTYVGTYITRPRGESPIRKMVWIAQRERKLLPDGTPRIIARTRMTLETLRNGTTVSGDAPIRGTTFVNVNAYTCESDRARRHTVAVSSVAYDEGGRELFVSLADINPDDPTHWWVNVASDSAEKDDAQTASRIGDQICSLAALR
jgi:hypothetical protein